MALAFIKHSTLLNDVKKSVQQEVPSTRRQISTVNEESTATATNQSSATLGSLFVQQEDQKTNVSSAGLGASLDKVFTGEPARPIEF